MPEAIFTCDYAAQSTNFLHFWEHTVGSGHATLASRADRQAQIRREEASRLVVEDHPFDYHAGQFKVSALMPPLNVAAIRIGF